MIRTLRHKLNVHEPVAMHSLGHSVPRWEDARGAHVGKLIDLTSGLLVANIGHDRDEIAQAVRDARGWTGWYSPVEARLRAYKALESILPGRKYVMLNSGSEAIDCAIKVCRDSGYEPVALPNHYWGNTIGARSLAEGERPDAGVKIAWFLQAFHGPTCRWLGTYEAGAFAGRQGMGDIVVFDENQAGFGRTGRMWGYEWFGIVPDIVVAGKAIAGGFPCSVVAGLPAFMDANPQGDYPSTFSGNAMACEALVESVRILHDERLVDRAHLIGERIKEWADTIGFGSRRSVVGINGRGAAWAVEMDHADIVHAVYDRCLKDGVIIMDTNKAVKIAPPLVISERDLNTALGVVKRAIEEETR